MIAFQQALSELPLVAILRGVTPEEAPAIGGALVDAGFRLIEVPLNSPRPFDSIGRLAQDFGETALIGAGTLIDVADVARVQSAGGRLIVMPHNDPAVISAAKQAGMVAMPGFATATEAFVALAAGADALKLFPAEGNPPAVLKALRAVLPGDVPVLPVGGITPTAMPDFVNAGASGFGLGSALYKPGRTAAEVGRTAREFRSAWERIGGIAQA